MNHIKKIQGDNITLKEGIENTIFNLINKSKTMKLEEKTFEEIYLIFVNDFLTIQKMAEYYQVNEGLLAHWIKCGKTANNTKPEDWEEVQDKINDLYFNLI
jgi:hypothetical protein